MLFSLADLQKAFGQEIFDHGEACLETTLVDSPDVMRDGELVTSLFRPPREKPYRVYIRIRFRAASNAFSNPASTLLISGHSFWRASASTKKEISITLSYPQNRTRFPVASKLRLGFGKFSFISC